MMTKVAIGIDIAKDKLDVAIVEMAHGSLLFQTSYANTAAGHQRLIVKARNYQESHLVMEATGTYHLALAKALFEAGCKQSVINPLQLKRFAQMKMRRLKTDRSDAQLLAAYGREQHPEAHYMQPVAEQQLKQINTQIRHLIKVRTSIKNLAHANGYLPESAPICLEVDASLLAYLDHAIERLEKAQQALIQATYKEVQVLIESVVGVGRRTSMMLIAYLGTFERFRVYKQLVAYVGLNPVPMESGTSLRRRMHISKQGQAELRTLFYLCALSAKNHNKVCRALYERQLAKGKPKKVALIAVANKLVKQVFTIVKSGVAFDNDYLEKMSAVS